MTFSQQRLKKLIIHDILATHRALARVLHFVRVKAESSTEEQEAERTYKKQQF